MTLSKLLKVAAVAGYKWGISNPDVHGEWDLEIGTSIREAVKFANQDVDECAIEFYKNKKRHGSLFWVGCNGTGHDTPDNFDECLTDWYIRSEFEDEFEVLTKLGN